MTKTYDGPMRVIPKEPRGAPRSTRVSQGPYSRWLRGVVAKIGRERFDLVCTLRPEAADALLLSWGVVPFKDSLEYLDNLVQLHTTGFPAVVLSEEP